MRSQYTGNESEILHECMQQPETVCNPVLKGSLMSSNGGLLERWPLKTEVYNTLEMGLRFFTDVCSNLKQCTVKLVLRQVASKNSDITIH